LSGKGNKGCPAGKAERQCVGKGAKRLCCEHPRARLLAVP
jgi:hypothetical protein